MPNCSDLYGKFLIGKTNYSQLDLPEIVQRERLKVVISQMNSINRHLLKDFVHVLKEFHLNSHGNGFDLEKSCLSIAPALWNQTEEVYYPQISFLLKIIVNFYEYIFKV